MPPSAVDLQERMQRVDALLADLEQSADPGTRAAVTEIVQGLLALHAAALRTVLERLAGIAPDGPAALRELADDELVANVLLLHELHPAGLEQRLRRAVADLAPALAPRGATAELLGLTPGGAAQVRIHASGQCGATRAAAREAVSQALYAAAPELGGIEFVDEPAGPSGFVPLANFEQALRGARGRAEPGRAAPGTAPAQAALPQAAPAPAGAIPPTLIQPARS